MAKTGVTFSIQQQLANIAKNKSILDGTYLSSENNENFTEMVKHLYPWDAERTKLLNPWSYLGNIISDKIKNFVWEADTDFDIDYDILVESILTRWDLLLKYVSNWGKFTLKAVKPETYWKNWGTEMIVKIYPVYENEDWYGTPTYYLYVQSYNWKQLKNELFQIQTIDNLSNWDPVDLSKVYELSHLKPKQNIEGLPRLVEVVDVIDRPMMDTIKTVIYSVDRKIAEAEKHFNDYSEQFKLFQNIDIPKSAFKKVDWVKVINWDALWKIVRTQDYSSVWDIKIIKNWNELLEAALNQMKTQVETVAAITDIPLEYFWVQTVRDSWTWKEVWSANLFKRINKYRSKISILLEQSFDFLSQFQKVDKSITWPAIIRASENDIIMQQTILLQNNMTSLTRAIKTVHWVDDEQAELILDEIKKDQSNWLLVSLKSTNQTADATAKTSASLK